ncbi:MAG: Lrp/AsnC family transcriptional regulator [Candidatus Baldrarchaeia archaeon]|mgnify:FL=1
MDEIDLAIIEYLKKDARTSFREIARKLGVSPDTIVNRFRMLQKKGIIQGSTVVINPEKIGYKSMVALMIDAEPEHSTQVLNKLIEIKDIILATKVVGDCDLMAIGVVRDFEHLHDLIVKVATIPHVKDIQVAFWVRNMKICPEFFII